MEMSDKRPKEEIAEDYCFVCKDGGKLLICEYGDCLKACHPQCVGKDESFFETGHCWTCGWHTCFICHRSSEYQCFCCPTSVCGACIIATDFVQLRKTKGFCSNCLKLLILSEENAEVDSDGCKLDFGNTETSEFLFKDYWLIIKEQEKLNIEDLYEAERLLKKGENYKDVHMSGKILEDEGELTSDAEYLDRSYNDEMTFPGDKVLRKRRKLSVKRFRFTKGNCTSWGSVELIEFLTSLGKDIAEPLKPWDVSQIIENYVNEKNLLHPNRKRKTVLCDDKLRSLFRKKTVKLIKIHKLLEDHFTENMDSDDSEFGSEEDAEPVIQKKNKNSQAVRNKDGKMHDPHKIYYASMTEKNIKLVYLRRSLIKELLKNPDLETFEKKVAGCFIRVKNDPRDFEFPPDKRYMLRQVSGIKSTTDVYTVGEISTSIVLRVSNIWKDVRISMLSEDDFEEEEFEDLCQLVKKGLFKQPTVEELKEKVRSVHADIMKHWIERELIMLQKRIDRANEKGWFREKCEYIERRALLKTEREQLRLLTEIPEVIPDIEDLEDMSNPHTDSRKESKGLKEIPELIPVTQELGDVANPQVDFHGESKGAKKIPEVTPDVQNSEATADPQIDVHIKSTKSVQSKEATEAKTEDDMDEELLRQMAAEVDAGGEADVNIIGEEPAAEVPATSAKKGKRHVSSSPSHRKRPVKKMKTPKPSGSPWPEDWEVTSEGRIVDRKVVLEFARAAAMPTFRADAEKVDDGDIFMSMMRCSLQVLAYGRIFGERVQANEDRAAEDIKTLRKEVSRLTGALDAEKKAVADMKATLAKREEELEGQLSAAKASAVEDFKAGAEMKKFVTMAGVFSYRLGRHDGYKGCLEAIKAAKPELDLSFVKVPAQPLMELPSWGSASKGQSSSSKGAAPGAKGGAGMEMPSKEPSWADEAS